MHVHIVRGGLRRRRAVIDLAGAARAAAERPGAAHQVDGRPAVIGVAVRVLLCSPGGASALRAGLGHRQRSPVGTILELGALGIELADVDHDRAHTEQDATADQDGYQYADGTAIIAAEEAPHWAGQT